jgi:hypothetical protein
MILRHKRPLSEKDRFDEASPAPLGNLRPVNPQQYPEWDARVCSHPGSSFYHLSHWARVLQETYGLQPAYLCRFVQNEIAAVLPLMEVSSPLRGRRGICLPFTDFCAPLTSCGTDEGSLYRSALEYGRQRRWGTVEWRGSGYHVPETSKSVSYWGHTLDLQLGAQTLFKRLKSTARCGSRKAERAGCRVEFTNSAESMRTFYELHCLTRKRHGMPCQPQRFFDNIARLMLANGHGFIATTWWKQQPVAAAIFFHHGREAVYKFGSSDYAFQHLRPNNLLMWESIKKCSEAGLIRLHFGRTSLNQHGLRRFKLGFGVTETRIDYYKYDLRKEAFVAGVDRAESRFTQLFRHMPLSFLRLAGRLLYPHFA